MPLFLKEKKSLIILIVLIFIQLVLISLQVPLEEENYFERVIFSVFSPIQHGIAISSQKIGNIWKNYFYLRNVQSQNQKMREEIFFLRQENNILHNALQELKEAKEIQDRLSKIHKNILAARVIGLDTSNLYKSITINKGSLDGLKKDMVIVDKYGNLVGRVINPISFKESRVQLITASESGISVFSEKTKVPGILTGDSQGGCDLKYILTTLPQNQDVSIGEALIASGYDGIFLRGLHVGEIISITATISLFKRIKVQPYFDFRHLDQVAVLLIDPNEIF